MMRLPLPLQFPICLTSLFHQPPYLLIHHLPESLLERLSRTLTTSSPAIAMYVYASDCGHRIAIILHDVPTRPDLSTVSAFSIRDQDCPTCGSHLYPFGEHYIGEVLVADANSLRNVIADDASSAARDSLAVGCPGYTACASSNASRHTCDAVIAVLNCLQLVELSSDERLCTNLITPTPVPYDAAAVVAERFEQQKNDAAAR